MSPHPLVSTAQYYEMFAHNFHNTGQTIWQHQLDTFHEYLPEGKILEIGSMSGVEADILSRWYQYLGVDIAEACIEVARKALPGINFAQCDLFSLRTLGQKFDGFWSAATFLHVPKDRMLEALLETQSVLQGGAIGFISLKVGEGEGLEAPSDPSVPARYYSYWQKDEFTTVLRKAKFGVIEVAQRTTEDRLNPDVLVNWLCFYVHANA